MSVGALEMLKPPVLRETRAPRMRVLRVSTTIVSVCRGRLNLAGTCALTGMLDWMRAWSIRAKLSLNPPRSWLETSALSAKTCPARRISVQISTRFTTRESAPVIVQNAGPMRHSQRLRGRGLWCGVWWGRLEKSSLALMFALLAHSPGQGGD